MSDDVKDFAYYAAKAEDQLNRAAKYDDQIYNPHLRATAIVAAEIYARLACGAPKADTSGVCPGRLFPNPSNGEFKICVLGAGHIGDHLTGGGAYFRD